MATIMLRWTLVKCPVGIVGLCSLLAIFHVARNPLLAQDETPAAASAETAPAEVTQPETKPAETPAETPPAEKVPNPKPLESSVPGLIDFNRDVRPILQSHCLECHGPKEAKEGFRVDEQDTLLGIVEPGDLAASSLWTDYLVTADEEMRMPPVGHQQALTGGQLATIKLWIEEGAKWGALDDVPVAAPVPAKTKTQRIATFLGLFHPAAVHFPVALLMISTFFVMCSFIYRDAFEGPAFHCLWIGAVTACASSALGWFFAESQGYSSNPSFDFGNGLERHRWTGIALSVLSLAVIPIALTARSQPNNRRRRVLWLAGSTLLAVLVSIAGHQGGELVFGEDLYTPAFKAIFEPPTPTPSADPSLENQKVNAPVVQPEQARDSGQ